MNCPKCGAPIDPGNPFCPNCGTNLSAAHKAQPPVIEIPKAYKPMSPWGYIGWSILFAIPVVGFILLIVFSFNKTNLNRRNYARSYWCALLIVIILVLITVVIAVVTGTTDELIGIFQQYASGFSGM